MGKPLFLRRTVQSYLTGLIGELTAMEIDSILLDSVQFPSGYALNKTYYIGESESGVSRSDVLKNFVASAKQAAGSKNVILMQSGEGALGGGESQYHGSLFGKRRRCLCAGFAPVWGLKASITIGGESFSPAKASVRFPRGRREAAESRGGKCHPDAPFECELRCERAGGSPEKRQGLKAIFYTMRAVAILRFNKEIKAERRPVYSDRTPFYQILLLSLIEELGGPAA